MKTPLFAYLTIIMLLNHVPSFAQFEVHTTKRMVTQSSRTTEPSLQELLQNPESAFRFRYSQQATTLPNGIWKLRKLRYLYLDGNQLEVIPEGIMQLQELAVLSLERNRLYDFPSILFKMPNLI